MARCRSLLQMGVDPNPTLGTRAPKHQGDTDRVASEGV